jgi:hypothetical protein
MSERGHFERAEIAEAARQGRAPVGPTRRARAALPLGTVGAGMLLREVSVRAPDVVFVKGLIEASDGLASVFAERGGELTLAAPHGRGPELDELLADLRLEIGAAVRPAAGGGAWDTERQER